jgi:uncharacterized membrane protein YfcA
MARPGRLAAGQVPGSAVGSQFAHHVQGAVTKKASGWFLIAFGLFFTIDRLVRHSGELRAGSRQPCSRPKKISRTSRAA